MLRAIRQALGIQAKKLSLEFERPIKTVERQIKTLMDEIMKKTCNAIVEVIQKASVVIS